MITSLLMGSHGDFPATVIELTANAVVEEITVAAGSYFVFGATASESFAAAVETAFESHSEVASCSVELLQNRRIRITCDVAWSMPVVDKSSFSVMSGFRVDTATATANTSDDYSRLIWVPDKLHSQRAAVGSQGLYRYDTAVGQSAPGRVTATQNFERLFDTFSWRNVIQERVMTEDRNGGEWVEFHRECLRKLYHFRLYPFVGFDDTATPVSSFGDHLGVDYVWSPPGGMVGETLSWTFEHLETYGGIKLPVVSASDYE